MHTPTFNFVDAAVGVLLLMGLLGGLKRGLSGELSRVAAFVVAGLAVWKFARPCSAWAAEHFSVSPTRGDLVAAALIFFLVLLVLWLMRKMLRHVMEFAFKGRLERVGGALCGLLRACVVALFFLLLASLAPQPELAALVTERSFFGRLAATYVRPIYTDLADRRPDLGLPTPNAPAQGDGLGEAPAGDSEPLGETTIPALSDQPER